MAQQTPNYGLEMPEATDDFKDFRESYNDNLVIIDNNMGGGGGSGGHTIYDEAGNALPQESGMQFTGAVTVSDDSGNGRTVVNIESGGGSTFGFAIDENNKLFEGTINNFNQSLSYTATEDGIALCWYKGSVGTWQFLLVNGKMLRLGGDGTNTPVSYSIPIRKGDTVSARYQSGSESCYFWLSVYGIKQGTNGIFAPVIYSDTERVIGVWRDNKPIYQKTVHVGALVMDSSWHNVSHGIANFDKCINIEAICIATNGTEFYPINLYRPTTNTGVMVYATASDVYYMNNYYSELEDAYFTIRYTKTTDVAGSGNWNTDGVPTVHYSTNEQVIGTWIDGKPIYEIVIPTVYTGSNFWDYPVATIPNYANITIRRIEGYNNVGKGGTSATVSMNYSHTDSNRWSNYFWVNDSTGEIMIGAGQSETVTNPLFIIQYTKTTD